MKSPALLPNLTAIALSAFHIVAVAQVDPFPDPYGEPIDKIISWWQNDGQEIDTDGDPRSDVYFVSEGTQPKLYLREKSSVSLTYAECDSGSVSASRIARIDITAVDGAEQVAPSGLHLKDYTKHFWLEHNMPNPVLNVPGYGWVRYEDIYPGISWHWYGGSMGTKMAFVCEPGSDPSLIALRFSGQDSLKLDWQGALKIYLNEKWLKFEQALAYQYDQQGIITTMNWGASYELVDGYPQVKFYYDSYDPTKPLVFFVGHEPLAMGGGPNDNIPYSSYLGTGMKDEVNEIAVAANGDYYTVGDIEDYQFPATVGLVNMPANTQTGMIAKFDKDYVKQWVGYYGKRLRSIALDEVNGRIIVGGNNATYGHFTQQYGNGYVLSSGWGTEGNSSIGMFTLPPADDVPELLWSTRWRSSTLNKVLVDSNGRIYVAGSIYQSVPLALKVPPGQFPFYQATHHGGMDGYVACFDANTNLVYSTYYGGEDDDQVLDMAMHENSNRLAIVGRTESIGHPGAGNCQVLDDWLPQCAGGGAFHQIYHNSNGQNGGAAADGLIAWFSLNLDWVWSTRFGGPVEDYITAAHFSPEGAFYVAGYIGFPESYCPTECDAPAPDNQGFPVCSVDPDVVIYGGLNEHFFAEFGPDRALKYSRFIGGSGYEFAHPLIDLSNDAYPMHGPILEVDAEGFVYMAGSTTSGGSSYPDNIAGQDNSQYYFMGVSNGASEFPPTDRSDVYLIKFAPSDHQVVYSTYYGGRSGIPVNQPGFSINQDVVTCMTTRDSRLFIGGSTASPLFFPVNALDGVANSFQQFTPPLNQSAGATDLTHAFVAQLSWVYVPVGITDHGTNAVAGIAAWFDGEGTISIQFLAPWADTPPVIDLFDVEGRLVFSQRAMLAGTRLRIVVPSLASGIYAGRLRDTPYTFRVGKP